MRADRWDRALREHEHAVHTFMAVCDQVAPAQWHVASAPGKWSPSDVALHICNAYELGRDAAAGGSGMRLRVTPLRAWMLRTMLLPAILVADRFPRGVRAPREVAPDPAAARRLSPRDARTQLEQAAREAADGLRRTDDERPATRVMHAYFGPLTPRAALRMLSAHTRHHARALAFQLEAARPVEQRSGPDRAHAR